tara:strand:+ start:5793 stop:6371 length:579 start_codon:yes stop_codon:yes gene_type:complete
MQTADKPIYLTEQEERENNDLQILSVKPNAPKESKSIFVKGTSESDVALFDRLENNIHRADIQRTSTLLPNGKTTRVEEHLDFEVKMVAQLTTKTSDFTTKKHFGKRITITSPATTFKKAKVKIEILWNVDITDLDKYDIDNKITYPEKRKPTKAERLGLSESELNRKRLESAFDDLSDAQLVKFLSMLSAL